MSVQTAYDEMRDKLREDLEECVKLAKELFVGEDIWGYNEMQEDYALDVYHAVKKAKDLV